MHSSSYPTEGGPRGTRLRAAGVMVGLLVSAALVWQSSQAAFTATTRNDANSWTAGTVVLTDNDSDNEMFNVTGLTPGTSTPVCVQVSYEGDLAARVKLYGDGMTQVAGPDSSADLDTLLTMDIEIGNVGSTCAAFVLDELIADDATLATLDGLDWSTGLEPTPNWLPDGSGVEMRPYRFTYTLPSNNAAQGDSAEINFVWEAQNT